MDQTVYKKLSKLLLLCSFGLSALFVFLARIYTVSCSDIVVMYTAWPEVLEILVNLVECTLFAIAFAIFIYAAYRIPLSGLWKFFLIYSGSVCFKYISNYIITWITDTGMSADYLIQNLTYILIYTAIELVQAGIVFLIVWKTMKAYHSFIERQTRIAANIPGTEISIRTYAYPFSHLITLKNPLQKNAFLSGCVIALFKVISRVIYDISYGMPTSIMDAFWMIVYYLWDLFIGFAVCLLITYLLMVFDQREQRGA